MAKNPIASQFQKFLSDLHAEKIRLERELSDILEAIGTAAGDVIAKVKRGRRGRPPLSAKAKGKPGRKPGRRRRRTGLTAEAFITKIVGDAGQLSTADINAAWKKERSGSAGNTLTKMSKEKKILKLDNPDGRGSLYKLPAAAPTV